MGARAACGAHVPEESYLRFRAAQNAHREGSTVQAEGTCLTPCITQVRCVDIEHGSTHIGVVSLQHFDVSETALRSKFTNERCRLLTSLETHDAPGRSDARTCDTSRMATWKLGHTYRG